MGYDPEKLLEHERSTFDGMKKHTEAMKGTCLEIVKEMCPDIIKIKQSFGAPELPPKNEGLPFTEAFDPFGRNKKQVGQEEVWDFYKHIDDCHGGRCVTISIIVWGQEKDKHHPVNRQNVLIPIAPAVESNETVEDVKNPFAEVRLDKWETVTVTIACEMYVEASNTARAEIDMESTDGLFFMAPRLRVDYVSRTIPIYDSPEMVEVIIPPELSEREFPPIPPIDGNGLPFDI